MAQIPRLFLPPPAPPAPRGLRRYRVSFVRPDGTVCNELRTGVNSTAVADDAMHEAGLGSVVRVLPVDEQAVAA